MDISLDPGSHWVMDPHMAMALAWACTTSWPNVGAQATRLSLPSYSMVPRHQHGHRLWLRPGVSMWPSVVLWATDINTVSGCAVIEPCTQTWLGCLRGPSWQCRPHRLAWPHGSIALRYQHDPRRQPRPLTLALPLMVSRDPNINIDPNCGRGTDLEMTVGSSPGPDSTVVPDGSTGHSDWYGPIYICVYVYIMNHC